MSDQNDGGYIIEGPSVAIISWIPYAYGIDQMAANEYTRHRHASAFGWMFDSGNRFGPEESLMPPDAFDGYGGFLDFLKQKEFRGACCLRNVGLRCDREGRPIHLSKLAEEYVGYTPMRLGKRETLAKKTAHYSIGQREARGNRSVPKPDDPLETTIVQILGFRIGTLGNFGTWLLTHRESQAPWVWAGLNYHLDARGAAQVFFQGSFIPSHRFYVDWTACGDHDMLQNDARTIDGFLKTGRPERADGGHLMHWTGMGRRS